MLYYKLENINNDKSLAKIINDLQRLISSQHTVKNKLLVVKIHDVTRDDNDMIPKLEYKN